MRPFFLLPLMALCFLALPVSAQPGPPPGGSASITAGVVQLEQQAVPLTLTLSGQALAEKDANIRPLVDGVITDILYTAGTTVSKGQPLFQIEQDTYQTALEVAEANLASAQAALPVAEENLKRYEQLAGTGVTQASVDSARSDYGQAKASVAAAKADLRTAQINLQRTTIVSPLAGRIETAQVSIGDLVTAGQSDVLTTVTQLNPIFVDLTEASSRMLATRGRIDSGEITPGDQIDARLVLQNGRVYAAEGELVSMGQKVSSTTGTVSIRLKFDNSSRLILPGMFVRANITIGSIEGYLIPQLAAKPQPDGSIVVWTLDEDKNARRLTLTPAGTYNNAWIVSQQLSGVVPLLVDNVDNLKDGTMVQTTPVNINPQGVVVAGEQPSTEAASEGPSKSSAL